jgi:two-component system phosphate regulon response regulator PhoB
MAKAVILIIEDDPEIRELLDRAFAREGWELAFAASGEAGLERLEVLKPDCVVLDIMLPGIDGLAALRAIRADPGRARLPVLLASARGEEADVVSGLELGADDYVVKPYSPKVLAARIRAALRRSADAAKPGAAPAAVSHGELSLDPVRHEAFRAGKPLDLSATEFALLELFLRHPGRVFTRSRIIDAVKGPDYPVTERAVDVQILTLRKKLGDNGELVETVRGVGYRLKD